jgi:hypothetical protein
MTDLGGIVISDAVVGPGKTATGAIISGWTSYTPTSSTILSNRNMDGRWRRVGDCMECIVGMESSGTWGTSTVLVSIPSGYTINNFTPTYGPYLVVGSGIARDAGTRNYPLVVYRANSTEVGCGHAETTGSTESNLEGDSPITFASSDGITLRFVVPISEWSGSGTMNVLQQDNLSSWTSYTPGLNNVTLGNGTISGYYRRNGSDMELSFYFIMGSTSSVTDIIGLDLPTGHTINTANIPTATASLTTFGSATALDTSAGTRYTASVVYSDTNTLRAVSNAGTSLWAATAPFTWATGDVFSWRATVPITEWAGSQNSVVGFSEANATQAGLVSTGTQTFAGIKNNASMPAFHAAVTSGQTFTTVTQMTGLSDSSTQCFDQGNCFASNTFTVPAGAAGIYFFYASVKTTGSNVAAGESLNIYIYSSTDSQNIAGSFMQADTNNLQASINVCCVASLAAGETVIVRIETNSANALTVDTGGSYFGGYKLY